MNTAELITHIDRLIDEAQKTLHESNRLLCELTKGTAMKPELVWMTYSEFLRKYWTCNCKEDNIHPRTVHQCPKCGSQQNNPGQASSTGNAK